MGTHFVWGNIITDVLISMFKRNRIFKEIMDNQDSLLSSYVSSEYLDLDSFEKRQEELKKVTKDMIIDVSSKIHLDTIYLLEGTND